MIPIECPKCGREGSVPPDRLNAKLTCRGCQAVFHLDNTGRMVMGAPGEPEKDKHRPHVQYTKPGEALDFSEIWGKIPKGVKIGALVVVLGLGAWQFVPSGGGHSYENAMAEVIRGVISNDRSKVVSYGSPKTSDAAGKWFDVVHPLVEKQGVRSDALILPELFSGDPTREPAVVVGVALSGSSPSSTPLLLNLTMVNDGGTWRFDGDKALSDAEKLIVKPKR